MSKPIAPWIRPDALEDYVYVLTRTYLPGSAEDVVFHVKTSSNVETVRVDAVLDFLEQNRDKVFITYDALDFHNNCLRAMLVSRPGEDHSALVWALSQECRLWDVGLLERRIRYAYAGVAPKIKESDGWNSFLMERGGGVCLDDVDGLLDAIRLGFVAQIKRAMENLPLFRRYCDDVPEPVSNDEYCDRMDCVIKKLIERDFPEIHFLRPEEWDVEHKRCKDTSCPKKKHRDAFPANDDRWMESDLEEVAPMRRRDLVVTGKYGPFGVGFDLQAALLAEHVNKSSRVDVVDNIKFIAQNLFERACQGLHQSQLKDCFKWQEDGDIPVVARNAKGYLKVNANKLQQGLTAIWQERHTFITVPFTFPTDGNNGISTRFSDWLDYIFLDPAIGCWLQAETAAAMMRQARSGTHLFGHASFPDLNCATPEVLLHSDVEPVITPKDGHVFVEVRFPEIEIAAIISTVFAEFLMHRRHEKTGKHFSIRDFESFFSPIPKGQETNPITEFQRTQTIFMEKDAAGLQYTFQGDKALWPKRILEIIAKTMKSYTHLETNDMYAKWLTKENTLIEWDRHKWFVLYTAFRSFFTCASFHLTFRFAKGIFIKSKIKARRPCLPGTHPLLFRLPFDRYLLPDIYWSHFTSVGLTSNFRENLQSAFDNRLSWSVINKIYQDTNLNALKISDDNPLYRKFQAAGTVEQKRELLLELGKTNVISTCGHLGRPVQYFEALEHDPNQLKSDIGTQVAFALFSRHFDVVLVSKNSVLLQIPQQPVKENISTIKNVTEQTIVDMLQSAYPQKNAPIDISVFFVAEKTRYSVSGKWCQKKSEKNT